MDTTTIPIESAARIDTYDDPVDLVCLFALRAFLDGSQPMARSIRLFALRDHGGPVRSTPATAEPVGAYR